MSVHKDQPDVLLGRALEGPGRFADTVRGRYRLTGERIRGSGSTLVDRPKSSRTEHHHHSHSIATRSTVWRPSFALHATLVVPSEGTRAVPVRYRQVVEAPGAETRRAIPALPRTVSMLTAVGRAFVQTTALPLRVLRDVEPAARLEGVRATPRIRPADTMLARPASVADDHLASARPAAASSTSAGPSTTWPTVGTSPSVSVPVSPAEVDRITRQVITTIDQRLSAYRERQGRW